MAEFPLAVARGRRNLVATGSTLHTAIRVWDLDAAVRRSFMPLTLSCYFVFLCFVSSASATTRGGLGSLAAWHLPGGSVGLPARWADTSNVEVGQTTGKGHGKRRERGTKSQRGGAGRREWNGEGEARDPQIRRLYLDIFAGAPECLVTPLLMGPVCLLNQGRFEEPVRLWKQLRFTGEGKYVF